LEGLRFLSLIQTSFVHLLFISSMFLPASVDRWPELFPEAQLYGYHAFLLFFTISGFIIAMPFARAHLSGGPQPSLKSYYWRRVTRIEPPYLLNIILLFHVRGRLYCRRL
jgi:peptidoglycan/LPS O-acetylase OafA/YrhL